MRRHFMPPFQDVMPKETAKRKSVAHEVDRDGIDSESDLPHPPTTKVKFAETSKAMRHLVNKTTLFEKNQRNMGKKLGVMYKMLKRLQTAFVATKSAVGDTNGEKGIDSEETMLCDTSLTDFYTQLACELAAENVLEDIEPSTHAVVPTTLNIESLTCIEETKEAMSISTSTTGGCIVVGKETGIPAIDPMTLALNSVLTPKDLGLTD